MHTAALTVLFKNSNQQKGMSAAGFKCTDIQITGCPVTLKCMYTALFSRAISHIQLSDLVIHIYFSIKILSNSIKTQVCGI